MQPIFIAKILAKLALFLLMGLSVNLRAEVRLDGLLEELSEKKLRKIFHSDSFLPLANYLYGLDPNQGLIKGEKMKEYSLKETNLEDLTNKINIINESLMVFSLKERAELVDSFHRDLANRLSDLERSRKWAELSLNYKLEDHSEAFESLDGEIMTSKGDGRAQIFDVQGGFESRRFPWGALYLDAEIKSVQYSDQIHDNKNFNRLGFKIGSRIVSQTDLIEQYQWGLGHKMTLSELGSKSNELSLTQSSVLFEVHLNSSKLKSSWFDITSSSVSIKYSSNNYDDLLSQDSSDYCIDYDSTWQRTYRRFYSLSEFRLYYGLSNSDNINLDFSEIGFNYSSLFKSYKNRYALKPKLNVNRRIGFESILNDRNDLRLDYGFSLLRYFKGNHCYVSLEYLRIDNSSDDSSYNVKDNRLSFEIQGLW